MSQWVRNEAATLEMRRDPNCPPDACVFDKGDLRAFVLYADIEVMPGPRWHIVLASSPPRMPNVVDAREAQEALLPGLEEIAVLPAPHAGECAIHICELGEQAAQRSQRRWRWLQ